MTVRASRLANTLHLGSRICHTVRMLSGQSGTTKGTRVDVRIDGETRKLLDDLASLYRSNRSHVVRLAVAELARTHGMLVGRAGRGTTSDEGKPSVRGERDV